MSPMIRRKLTIEQAVLGLLKRGPLHGYKLHKQLSNSKGLGCVWRIKQAQLYAWLDRLQADGYITSSLQQQETRPARRVFMLTQLGEDAFTRWLHTPVQSPRQVHQEFLAKLYFISDESVEVRRQLIGQMRTECQRWLERHSPQPADDQGEKKYFYLVDSYRHGQIQAMVEWLDKCNEYLGK